MKVPTMSSKGPLPRFAKVHFQEALELIAKHGRVGRKDLADKLRIGEGSMRTVLNQLKRQGLITSSRVGHSLTDKGRRALGQPFEFVQVDVGGLVVGKVSVATIVRGAATRVKRGIEQRDEAIKAGAQGATVLIFDKGRLKFPDDFLKIENETSNMLVKALSPRDGDVIVIGTGEDAIKAERGALAAVKSLAK